MTTVREAQRDDAIIRAAQAVTLMLDALRDIAERLERIDDRLAEVRDRMPYRQ
jgi:hypothetical protein